MYIYIHIYTSFIPLGICILYSPNQFHISVAGKSQVLHSKLDSQQVPVILVMNIESGNYVTTTSKRNHKRGCTPVSVKRCELFSELKVEAQPLIKK